METKAFEIRDASTFFAVIATNMRPDATKSPRECYLLRRSGYSTRPSDQPLIMLCRMDANGNAHQASYAPYGWGGCRTYTVVQLWIAEHWDSLKSGDVLDVEFLLGETAAAKQSEAVTAPL